MKSLKIRFGYHNISDTLRVHIAVTLNPSSRTEIDDIINFLASQSEFIEIRQSK